MLIKYQALASQLQKKMQALYVLVGQDQYLLNDAALQIKKSWRQRGECDEKILHLNTPADWSLLIEEANSYSLFAEYHLLDARFEKKSVDAAGKEVINQYLQHLNPRCLIMLHAYNVPPKQLQWLANNEQVVLVQITPFTDTMLQNWISTQLQQKNIPHVTPVPALILQYTQGNMLACAQVIDKLALITDHHQVLSLEEVREHLIDQCEFQLYELADACLAADGEKALHLLRKAYNNRIEPTLILWLLTQEIRQLIQLSFLLKQALPLTNACNQLKIWPQRARLYERTLTRLSLAQLYHLLRESKQLDERIKTSQGNQIWQCFDQLALSLCLGR